MFEDIEGFFRRSDEHRNNMEEEYRRLLGDPCLKQPRVGDRVIVAAGLLGRGHLWVRLEAVVLEVASSAYRVRFSGRAYNGKEEEDWVVHGLITDVIPSEAVVAVTEP